MLKRTKVSFSEQRRRVRAPTKNVAKPRHLANVVS